MEKLVCDNIGKLFEIVNDKYEINLAYQYGSSNGEKKEICVSSRRKYSISIEPETDVLLVVYCAQKSLYSVKKVYFDEMGVTKLAPILDKLGVQRVPASSETWSEWKKYGGVITEIFLFERGYYTIDYLWLDCNVWQVVAHMPDGIAIDGRQLKVLHYLRSHIKIEDDFYDFIHKMLSEGCSENEYKAFKKQYYNTYAESTFGEYFEK